MDVLSAGEVNLKIAGFVRIGFIFGGLLEAKIAPGISNEVLQRVPGVVLLLIALKMYSGSNDYTRSLDLSREASCLWQPNVSHS